MTMQLSRRQVARLTLAMATGTALAACAGKTQDELTQDVMLIANGLSSIVNALQNPDLHVPADILAQAQAAIDDIMANAAAVGSVLAPNSSAINAISTAVDTLAALLAPFFPVSTIVASVVQAALALIPTILAFISAPAPVAAASAAKGMTPSAARVVLQAAPMMLHR